MKEFRLLILLCLPAFAFSCMERGGTGRPVIPYVENMLADTSGADFRIVSSAREPNPEGCISIVGEPEDVFGIAEELRGCDYFDNVDGSMRSDNLPDFAGETITGVADSANFPYSDFISKGDEDGLRKVNVMNFLSAMDTVAFSGQEDRVFKLGAKIVVLASSHSSAYGYYNIDTLCKAASAEIKVISRIQAMREYAERRRGAGANIAVWAPASMLAEGVYEGLQAFSPSSPDAGGTLEDKVKSHFLEFIEMYSAAGNTEKLSAVLLDTPSVPLEVLEKVVAQVQQNEDGTYSKYKNLMDTGFECISAGKAVAYACYGYLRSINGFTHRIAYPEAVFYRTVEKGSRDLALIQGS